MWLPYFTTAKLFQEFGEHIVKFLIEKKMEQLLNIITSNFH